MSAIVASSIFISAARTPPKAKVKAIRVERRRDFIVRSKNKHEARRVRRP
jgi:hypothetical protein